VKEGDKEKPHMKVGKLSFSHQKKLELAALFGVVLLAAALRFTNLESLGYVNHYYTAAVKSMLQSWHNFFYVAAEPGGSVSVDKPPLGLWLQVISAYFLGVNGFSVLLPQLLAGTASVILLYHLVRRSFGVTAGLLAALTLAITPIVVATDRNNTMDSTLILTLLFAAWAFIKATETNKMRYLFLGAVLVGLGFNIKMLQAYLPLPAFFAMYFLGARETVWQKAGKLALTSVVLLAVSLSWAVAVDLTPADQRPYVGSSSDNSQGDLILGYNGVNRLLGMFGRRNDGSGNRFAGPQNPGLVQLGGLPQNSPDGNFSPPNAPFPQRPPGLSSPQDGSGNPGQAPAFGSPRGGGFMGTGQPGALRLFIPPLSKEVSWLLPFALVSTLLVAVGSRWEWPVSQDHQALVLWGGWLLTCMVFFSIAGFFHEYYLSMLAPPLAALVAIGVKRTQILAEHHPWLSNVALGVSAVATLAFQWYTANNFTQNLWWMPVAIVLALAGLAVLVVAAISQERDYWYSLGFTLVIAAMFLTPGIWSALTNLSASQNQSLPSAYSGGEIGPVEARDLRVNSQLLDYLEANTQDMNYLLAVPSSMQGTDYVLATGRPVLYMGGFNGQDQIVTADDLAEMVNDGELRFIYWNTTSPGRENNSEIGSWVSSACTPVQGFETTTRNAGAPDGTIANLGGITASPFNRNVRNTGGPGGGNMSITLYDCVAKKQ
jgi:4-amino-4-deoxy-L-arabinose transferase-like glycosyltransferase